MYFDSREDQVEARLIQLRQQRQRKQSQAEQRGSRNKLASTTGYASDAVKPPSVPIPGMSFMTDAVKTPIVPMPGMSLMTPPSGGNVYAPTHMSRGPAGKPVKEATSCSSLRQTFVQRMLNEIRLTQLMLAMTLIASILFLKWEVPLGLGAFSTGKYWLALEDGVFVGIVGFLIYGNLIYQLTRIGYLKRIATHTPANPQELEDFLYKQGAPPLAILVPSYKEDVQVITQTLLSAALQEYPHRRVVLLIDDPPSPGNWEESMKLIAARNAPSQIHLLLSEQDNRLRSAWQSFATRLSQGCLDRATEMARLAALYQEVAQWFKRQAETYPIRNHTDEFFVQRILLPPFDEFWLKAQELQNPQVMLSPQEVEQAYRRLASLFHVELSSFERKNYRNLSHEPNKAMNLNSYMGLLGKSWQEVQKETGRFLEEVSPSPNALQIPDATYLITLDADSLLLPKYAQRLVYLLEQPGNEKIAVAQTPYSAIPKASRLIERIAGATTDMQYLIHQGFTYYRATFWVGANAVLRKAALEDIRQTTREGDVEITRYIQDRTVIEDTESTIDLREKGWHLYNYPERLAYSATPPDFGALLIQRRRWANGGLLLLPKLLRFLLRRPYRFPTLVEGMIRLHYLVAIGAASLATLLLLVWPFDKSLDTIWLPLTAVPYYVLYGRDLVKIGYRKSDLLAVYALNIMLIPIHLGGAFMSLYQAVAGKKIPFGRTPKVKERTGAPKRYILLEFLLLPFCLLTCLIDLQAGSFVRALYSAGNALVLLAIFTWFIGWKESTEDVFGPRVASHRGAARAMSARPNRMLDAKAIILHVAGLLFLLITLVSSIHAIAK